MPPKSNAETKEVNKGASKGDGKENDAENCIHHWESAVQLKEGQKEYENFKKQDGKIDSGNDEDEEGESGQTTPKKRGRGANQSGTSKKQKKDGSEPKGTAGDKNRVPKKGQKVQWHSLPGYVDGEVVEVVYENKKVDGKSVKASKEDPRVVLRSSASGKIAVHKPGAVYFD